MDKRHFSWFIKLLFLLLMMLKVPAAVTRPLRGARRSDLIAGNELAKLFLERDELQRGLRSSDHQRRGEGNSSSSFSDENHDDGQEEAVATSPTVSRGAGGRSLDYKGRKANDHARGEESKSQVVKLVTSGSKIVFLEDEYDEDDAAVADAANIELQRERQRERKPALESNQPLTNPHSQRQQQRNPSDGIKVVAVSISSSSKRTHAPQRSAAATTQSEHADPFSEMRTRWQSQQRKHNHYTKTQQSDTTTSSAPKSVLSTTTTTKATTTARTASQRNSSFDVASPAADFINRSHKSELLIEESEPRTMPQSDTVATSASTADTYYTDSEDSASTSIRKVLAAPRTTAAGTLNMPHVTTTPTTDQSNNRSSTRTSKSQSSSLDAEANSSSNKPAAAVEPAVAMGDQLLPFQTVIYHDTKEGHGPQSRSISYSSISQNVEDLHAWRKSGILAEAQRNVSESLKPSVRPHDSEPAKFYSIPAKMYSMPSKFYSEPAKVYSEPAKVYGEPEKFYSQPAKMYGEPSKFYSEPAKVYSQPAKVYGEPAKTYWPQPASTATTTSRSSTTTTPPSLQTSTTFGTPLTRRPAIVSRIAFGEAKTADGPADTGRHSDRQRNHHSQSNAGTQPRRVLFNLDKLPYDLLNAPEQSPKRLLEAAWDARLDADTTTGDFAAGKQQASCWESSSPHQQHSPPLLDPHSNQNARGSPNTVKCAARYPNQSAVSVRGPATSTEPSHTEELYTATPEQNYEIEESVSVVTNGRYHGIQGSAGPATTATITTTPHSRIHWRGGSLSSGTHRGSPSSNRNAAEEDTADDHAADKNYAEDEGDNEHNNDNGDNEDDGDIDGHGGYHRSSNNNNKNNYNNGNKNNSSQSDSKDDSKVAYVVEGRNYRKYRVEEKTDDGFIVGEYGVVDHNDGNLRGVRYTADSTINRSLIQKALLTFLKLK